MIKLFGFATRNTLVEWEKNKEKRPIINLINNYFSEEDISQFLEKGKIDRLDWLKDCKNVTDFIIKEVFDKCQNIRQAPEVQVFGKFLETIQDARIKKTWIEFTEFLEKENDIYKWLEKEFAKYLIQNNLNIQSHIKPLNDIYKHFPISHRYYFIKNFMWIFMPTIVDNKLSQIKKIYGSLPSYIKSIPGIKSMIKTAGTNIFVKRS